MNRSYVLGATFTVLLSLIIFFSPTNNMRWDPSYYYAQLQSPLIDRDLDFRTDTLPQSKTYTATGLQPSPWPTGPSILWSPFFIAAHFYLLLRGKNEIADGFAPEYIASVSAGSALYGLLGLFFVYRLCRLFTRRWIAIHATTLALMATPLFYYIYRQPLMAHSGSLMVSALFIYCLFLIQRGNIPVQYYGLVIGVCIGLSVILRRVGIVSLVPVLFYGMYLIVENIKRNDWIQLRQITLQGFIAAGVAIMVVAPQLVFEYKLYGSIFDIPRSNGFSESLFPGNLWKLLFHSNRGLLFWSPFILFGLLGLYKLQIKPLKFGFAAYVLGYMYILGIWKDWYGGGGFGPRYFIEILPLSALGWSLVTESLVKRTYQKLILVTLHMLLVFHQMTLVAAVENGWIDLQRYFAGDTLGIGYQLDSLIRILNQPLSMLLPRSTTASDRQSMLMNSIAGGSEVHFYFFALVAIGIIVPGIYFFLRVFRFIRLPVAGMCVVAYMLFWIGILATL